MFIHSSCGWTFGWFLFGAIMNNSAMNIDVQVCEFMFLPLLGVRLGADFLGHVATNLLASSHAILHGGPTGNATSLFLHVLTHFVIVSSV